MFKLFIFFHLFTLSLSPASALYLAPLHHFFLLCTSFQMSGITSSEVHQQSETRCIKVYSSICVKAFMKMMVHTGVLWFLQLLVGLGSETHQAMLGRCSTSHTVLPCPCTLSCQGFHRSRNALPIMRVRGQSAIAPGGRDLPGTLSH